MEKVISGGARLRNIISHLFRITKWIAVFLLVSGSRSKVIAPYY